MKYKLADVLKNKTQGVNTTTDKIKYVDSGYKIVQAKNIEEYIVTFDENNCIDEETYNRVKENHKLHKGDVLYTNIGSQLGNSALYNSDEKAIITWNVMKLIPNEKMISSEFLCYLLNYNKSKIKTLNSSSTMPFVSGKELMNFEINIPTLEIQNKITKILDMIQSKIRLNNQINDNLYELLKISFNNWINNLGDYTITNLSFIANYKNGLAMQKFRPVNEEGLPVIKIKEMNSGLSNDTERCSSNIDKDAIVNDGDVLFAWSGTLCMTIWCNGKAGLNQHIFKVTSEKFPKWFYYFWTLKHLDKFIQIAAGKATTMGHIKRNELDNAEVLLPDHNEILKMDKIMAPILEKYIENLKENKRLEQLRDTLLPKLMNGQIDLEKIKI